MIEILQIEDSTRQTLSEMNSTGPMIRRSPKVRRKLKLIQIILVLLLAGRNKILQFQASSATSARSPTPRVMKMSARLRMPGCGVKGHYKVACKKQGNFPQKPHSNPQNPSSTGRMNIAAAAKEPALNADFFNEKGYPKDVLSATSDDKPVLIEFGCGLTPPSFDRKLILQADTGADSNATNKKTFEKLFPDVELEESTFLLQNFDKRLIRPIGSFRCFLRWKGHKYRVKIEVMGTDTPNILSRETTFLMGILKKCLPVEKVPINQVTPDNV